MDKKNYLNSPPAAMHLEVIERERQLSPCEQSRGRPRAWLSWRKPAQSAVFLPRSCGAGYEKKKRQELIFTEKLLTLYKWKVISGRSRARGKNLAFRPSRKVFSNCSQPRNDIITYKT
jgi:hypothetical protein